MDKNESHIDLLKAILYHDPVKLPKDGTIPLKEWNKHYTENALEESEMVRPWVISYGTL